mmetsp:Transcript_58236/g.68000  ORF Transcript_58236/g.68000 Transcript_58236/m.68000 type:complete len:192 (-) Transcript_58236:281-856(-)
MEKTKATIHMSATNASSQSSSRCSEPTVRCSKCGQKGMKSCTQRYCFKCCDDDSCRGHNERREALRIEQDLIDGNDLVSKKALGMRALTIRPGSFREKSFQYLGETLVIWSARDFFAIPKWRNDVSRKPRKSREILATKKVLTSLNQRDAQQSMKRGLDSSATDPGRRKRFQRVMNELFDDSMKNQAAKDH